MRSSSPGRAARPRARIRPSDVLAALALFVALGGTAWALANNSVESRHIANGEVKSADLMNAGIKAVDLKDGVVSGDHVADETLGAGDSGPLPHREISATELQTFGNNNIETVEMDDIGPGFESGFDLGAGQIEIERTGRYVIVGEIVWQDAVGGQRALYLSVDGSASFVADNTIAPAPPPSPTTHQVVTVESLAIGDTVELRALQTSGSALSSGLAYGRSASLSLSWLGPVNQGP